MIPCVIDPDLHFDDKRAPEAARMCRACPAREACLALALDMESGRVMLGLRYRGVRCDGSAIEWVES